MRYADGSLTTASGRATCVMDKVSFRFQTVRSGLLSSGTTRLFVRELGLSSRILPYMRDNSEAGSLTGRAAYSIRTELGIKGSSVKDSVRAKERTSSRRVRLILEVIIMTGGMGTECAGIQTGRSTEESSGTV